MSMWADYQLEVANVLTIEAEYGFVTYSYQDNECYIRDIYVVAGQRRSGLAAELADMVAVKAKETGCKILLGTVVATNPDSTDRLKVLLGYNMKLRTVCDNIIVFEKEI